ncbi:hypothetical protein [Mycobacterium talmoniae]|uniref:Uncharacterized protein n=1 Tax=Mycobacterium talmoniae TaxID=1858794 RepID=A0A1S1NJ00_9MYCO|nr:MULTISPECIES: hypothetical protein [Mycobacterium]OHV04400.1 hypothetical protein BKN37_10195 [Mycobacterium talmoniae]TDH54167.1 hypothetical protein E2F47_11620 [Mycobacterium eburneum]
MAPPHQPDPSAGDHTDPAPVADDQPRIIRLRIVPWDVICTVALLALLVVVATTTDWWPRLFGFLDDVCAEDDCPPAPFGINYYVYPVVWGGLGAAVAAAILGPFVSLLKGWYMCFWMAIALAMVLLSSLVGSLLSAVQ